MTNSLKRFFSKEQVPDREELADLFHAHYLKEAEFLRTTVYWMVRSQAVDDIIQETFLRAWKYFPKFRHQSSFRTWIYRIAMNATYDYLKKEKSNKTSVLIDNIESLPQQPELTDLISKALFLMSEKQREVFLLHYKLEYKQAEIAELLNISEGTIKSRLFKARNIFQEFFKKNGSELV